ncbi:MAG: phage baseplate assembly protein V [bacterium]|nr:phage baseplate assembly protein V [bacterium]
MNLQEILEDEKLTRLKNRYFGIWRGVVTNVNDPKGLGRIKAKVHELLGDKDETNWASYCAPFGGGGHGWFFMLSPVTKGAKDCPLSIRWGA